MENINKWYYRRSDSGNSLLAFSYSKSRQMNLFAILLACLTDK